MKVLVTGANGYLGIGIIKELLEKGNEVIAVDFNVNDVDNRAEKYSVNLFEITDPYNYFKQPDVLLHLAWRDGFIHYSDSHINDLPNHYIFIKKLIESGIKQVSILGSMHEVGFFEGSIDENTPCYPVTPYGISKNALRQLIQEETLRNNVVFQWLRGYYIVGNSSYGNSIFSKIMAAAQEGKKTFPFTMGQNQFDFLDYSGFCNQVVQAISQNEINGIINICSGKPEKLADRVEEFIRDNNLNIKLQYGAFPDRPYDSKAIWGNSKKIEEIMKKNK